MATATKAKTELNAAGLPVENPNADVHHMIRTLGTAATADGAIDVNMADEAIRNWLQAGFRIAHIESLGSGDTNGVYFSRLLYILVKDQ